MDFPIDSVNDIERSDARTGKRSDSFVESFAKGLAVIRAFGPQSRRMTLSGVAVKTGLSRAAARRILLTLQTLGYVAQSDRDFFLTPRILDLGYSYLSSMPLVSFAQPVMEELVAELGQSCSAGVLDGNEVVYIHRVARRSILAPGVSMVGMRLPAYVSSMGRVLLSGLPAPEWVQYLGTADLKPLTPHTVTTREALDEEIGRVRKQGHALVVDELEQGLSAIAVPIADGRGNVVAALNVSCNSGTGVRQKLLNRSLPLLRKAAARVTSLLAVQSM